MGLGMGVSGAHNPILVSKYSPTKQSLGKILEFDDENRLPGGGGGGG
jgi:hypothetical protein